MLARVQGVRLYGKGSEGNDGSVSQSKDPLSSLKPRSHPSFPNKKWRVSLHLEMTKHLCVKKRKGDGGEGREEKQRNILFTK